MCALREAGEAIEPGLELWLVDIPAPGINVGENGLRWWVIWLLEADEVGSGGENGNGGYCMEACRLILETAGDAVEAGPSLPRVTPNARSLASDNSLTYESQSTQQKC